MICSKCGYVSLDGDLFCIKCGNPLRKPEEPAAPVEKPSAVPEEAEPIAEPEAVIEEPSYEPAAEPAVEINEPEPEEAVEEPVEEPEPVEEHVEEHAEEPEPVEEPVEEPAAEPEPVEEPVEEPAAEPEPVEEIPVEEPATEPVKSYFTAPVKVNAEPVEDEVKEAADIRKPRKTVVPRLEKPLTVWGFLWRTFLFSIPVVNIIALFIFAFAPKINKNSKNFAASVLIIMLIGLIITVCCAFLVFAYTDPTVLHDFILKYFRLSIEF